MRAALGAGARRPASSACFDELFAHYARPRRLAVYPTCAASAPRRSAARGLRLGVVSNFDGGSGRSSTGLGLAPLVDAVVWSTGSDAAKPDARLFHGRRPARRGALPPTSSTSATISTPTSAAPSLRASAPCFSIREAAPHPTASPSYADLRDLPASLGS